MTTDITVLDHLVVVNLEIHIWISTSGRPERSSFHSIWVERSFHPKTWPRSAASASAIPTTCAVSALSKLAL